MTKDPGGDRSPADGEPSLQWLEDRANRFLHAIWPILALIAAYIIYKAVKTA